MIPEGTTFLGVALKQLLVGLSAFASGVLLYRALFFERHRKRAFLGIGYGSVALMILVLGELIVRTPFVNPTLEAVLYAVALTGIGVGFLGDALWTRKHQNQGKYL